MSKEPKELFNLKFTSISSESDISDFLKHIPVDDIYEAQNGSRVVNAGQKLINQESMMNMKNDLYSVVHNMDAYKNQSLAFAYDKKNNTIVGIAYNKGISLEGVVKRVTNTGKEYTKIDNTKGAKFEIPMADKGGWTAGAGKFRNANIAVFGNRGLQDKILRTPNMMIAQLNTELTRPTGKSGAEGARNAISAMQRAANAIYNNLSKEAKEEEAQMKKIAGKDNLNFIENAIRSSELLFGDYLQKVALSYQIVGRNQRLFGDFAQRILKSENPAATASAIMGDPKFRSLWGNHAPSMGRRQEMLDRLVSLSGRYGLSETTLRNSNEETIARGSIGSFDMVNKFIDRVSTEIKRDQTLSQAMRIPSRKTIYTKSGYLAPKELEDLGLKRGVPVKGKGSAKYLPFDAQVLGLVSGTGRFNTQDTILASEALLAQSGFQREFTARILNTLVNSKDENGKRIRVGNIKNLMDNAQKELEKLTPVALREFSGMNEIQTLNDFDKKQLERLKYKYLFEQEAAATGRHSEFMLPKHFIEGGKLEDVIQEDQYGNIIIKGIEKVKGGIGTAMLGHGAKGPADVRYVTNNGKRVNFVDTLGKDIKFAYDIAALGNNRKSGDVLDLMVNTLFQEYGNEKGKFYQNQNNDIVNNLQKLQQENFSSGSASSARTRAIQAFLGSGDITSIFEGDKDKEGRYRINTPKLMENLRGLSQGTEEFGSSVQELLLVIDDLINGFKESGERMAAVYEGQGMNRYFRRDAEGNIDYTGMDIRAFTAMHPRTLQYEWGEVDYSKAISGVKTELKQMLQAEIIDQIKYDELVAQTEEGIRKHIKPRENDVKFMESAQQGLNRTLMQTAQSGTEEWDRDTIYKEGNKQGRYLIRIASDKDMHGMQGAMIPTSVVDEVSLGPGGVVLNSEQRITGLVQEAIQALISQGIDENQIDIAVDFTDGNNAFKLPNGAGGRMLFLNPALFNPDMPQQSGVAQTLDKIVDTYRDEGAKAAMKYIPDFFEEQQYDIEKEGGVVYEKGTHSKTKGTGGFIALPINNDGEDWLNSADNSNIGKIRQQVATHGALVSSETFKQAMGGLEAEELKQVLLKLAKSSNNKGIKQQLQSAANKKNGKTGMLNLLTRAFTLQGSDNDTKFARDLIESVDVDKYNELHKFVKMGLARGPFQRIFNNKWINPFVSADISGQRGKMGNVDVMRIAAPLMKQLGGDYDTDVISALIQVPKEFNEVAEKQQEYEQDIIEGFAMVLRAKGEDARKAMTQESAVQTMSERLGKRSALEQRMAKANTGILGNLRGNYQAVLEEQRLGGKEITPEQEIVTGWIEGMAQDAISSKKTINAILNASGTQYTQDDIENMMQDESRQEEFANAYEKGWDALSNTVNDLYQKDKSFNGLWNAFQKVGLVKESEGGQSIFEPEKWEILADPFFRMMKTEKGRKFISKNFFNSEDFQMPESIDQLKQWESGTAEEQERYKTFISKATEGWGKDLIQEAWNLSQQQILNESKPGALIKRLLSKKDQPEKAQPDLAKKMQSLNMEDVKMAAALQDSAEATESLTDILNKILFKMDELVNGPQTKEERPEALSITTAVDRALPSFKPRVIKEGQENKIGPGVFGHKILELMPNEWDDSFFESNQEYKDAEAEYRKSLGDISEKEKDIEVQNIKNRAKTLQEEVLKSKINDATRTAIAKELSLGQKSGLHGRLDDILLEQYKNEEGEDVFKLIAADSKFSEAPGHQKNVLEVFLQQYLLRQDQQRLKQLVYDEGGSWFKNDEIAGWDRTNRGLIREGVVESVLNRFVADIGQNAYGNEWNSMDLGKKAELEKQYRAYAEALMKADFIEGEIHGVNKNNDLMRILVGYNASPQVISKLVSGQVLTNEEKAQLSHLTQYGDFAQPQPQVPKKPFLENDITKGIAMNMSGITRMGITGTTLREVIKSFKKIYQLTLQLDESLTNLRVVTGDNVNQARSLMRSYNDLAKELGTTTKAVATSATEWLRQGYNTAETEKLITSSTYLAKLGFMDQTQAVQALTSAMKGFNLSAEDSMSIVDKLTTLDAKYATTAGDIATAMSQTAAVANSAGLGMEETAAALTTIMDVSQMAPGSAGTALKSMLSRYGNVKAGAFGSLMGEGEDTENINDIEKVLNTIGIKIRTSTMDMRDYDDVLADVAEKWQMLDQVTRNAISTAMAGTRNRNAFETLVSSYDTYSEALQAEQNSEGTATRKYDVYKESIAFQKEELTAAWESLVQRIEESDAIKLIYQGLTLATEHLDKIFPLLTALFTAIVQFKPKLKQAILNGLMPNRKATVDNTNATKNNTKALQGEKVDETDSESEKSKNPSKFKKLFKGPKVSDSLAAGAVTGVTYGMSGGGTLGNFMDEAHGISDYETTRTNIMTGVASGIGTFALSLIWGPIGGMIGGIVGDGVASLIKYLTLRDQKERAERVAQANAELDLLSDLNDSINTGSTLAKQGENISSASDWKQLRETALALKEGLLATDEETGATIFDEFSTYFNESAGSLGLSVENVNDALDEFATGTEDATKIMAAYTAAQLKYKAESEWKAGEATRYDIYEELASNQSALAIKYMNETDAKTRQEIASQYKSKYKEDVEKQVSRVVANRQDLQNAEDDYRNTMLQAYFQSSGLSTLTTADMQRQSLNTLLYQFAQAVSEDEKIGGGVFDSNGNLTDEFKTQMVSLINSDETTNIVSKGSTKSVTDINRLRSRSNLSKQILDDYDYYVTLSTSNNINELGSLMSQGNFSSIIDLIKYISDLNPSTYINIAHGLGLTVSQLEESGEKFNWVSEELVMSGLDGLIEAVDKFESIITDFANDMSLSLDNLEYVMQKFPSLLIGDNGKISQSNVMGNLANILTPNGTLDQLFAGQFWQEYTSGDRAINAFKVFRESQKAAAGENGDWIETAFGISSKDLDKKVVAALESETAKYSNVLIEGLFSTSENGQAEWVKTVNALITDLGLENIFREKLIEYQTNEYDKEIDNLQSIKDSLEDINKLRQKELDLMKAKEALANASKEKKTVYMEGLGMVQMSDQEAIREAQEKVDELERQQTQEDIQYQIDILEQQKNYLAQIAKNEEVKSIQETVKALVEKNGNASVATIIDSLSVSNLSEAIKGAMQGVSETQKEKNEEDLWSENGTLGKTLTAANNYQSAIDKAQEAYETYGAHSQQYRDAYKDVQDAYDELKGAAGDVHAELAGTAMLNAGNTDFNKDYNWIYKHAESNINTIHDALEAGESNGLYEPSTSWNDPELGDMNLNKKPDAKAWSYFATQGGSHSLTYYKMPDDTEWHRLPDSITEGDLQGKKFPVGTIFREVGGGSEYAGLKTDDGIILYDNYKSYNQHKGRVSDHITLSEFASSYFKPIEDNGITTYIRVDGESDETVLKYRQGTGKGDLSKWYIKDGSEWKETSNDVSYFPSFNISQNASGTTSFSGGSTLINEQGLEGIITPQGTLTSLPAKSGILPADLTKNLWKLGEVAPNLVARLGSNTLETTNNAKTEDNSISVGTLTATFNTGDDFDAEAFWSSVRSEIILTKHNH